MNTTWNINIEKPKYPPLNQDIKVDVVIVGGGLSGVISAYLLCKEGKKVALIEARELGSNATLLTTAFLTQVLDTSFVKLNDMFGHETAKTAWQSGNAAINEIERIAKSENISCEFTRCPAYEFAHTKKQFEKIEEDYKISRDLGFDTELHRENFLNFKNVGYLEIKNQAKFHPGKFLFGLSKKAKENGVLIFEDTEAVEIMGSSPVLVKTKNGCSILADDVLITTYRPFGEQKGVKFKKGMYISYVLEFEIPSGMLQEAMYWDIKNPYNYFRVDKRENSDRLILGGADHREEIPVDPKKSDEALEEFLRKILGKKTSQFKIVNMWAGPILESADGLAFIGKINPHYYIATAFSGNGMTYSMISAMIFRELLFNRENEWVKIYDPTRVINLKKLYQKGKDYIGEFFGGAVKNMLK